MPNMPSMPGMPSMTKPKKRKKDNNYPFMRFEIWQSGSYQPTCSIDGSKVTLKGVSIEDYFADGDGDETATRDLTFKATSDAQAQSWADTLWSNGCGGGPVPPKTCKDYSSGQEGVFKCSGVCGQNGTVWGSGPYTYDSPICRAARHAGILKDPKDPKCPGCQGVMPWKNEQSGTYSGGWSCNGCGQQATGERFVCVKCTNDFHRDCCWSPGKIKVAQRPNPESNFLGSLKNGITTTEYGSYQAMDLSAA